MNLEEGVGNTKHSEYFTKKFKKWKVKLANSASMDSVDIKKCARKDTLVKNAKIWQYAKTSRHALKGTQETIKNYTSGNCRFKSDCSYYHQEKIPEPNEEHNKLVQKVNELEKVVQAQNRMVLNMQKEITELKKKM